jgi:hypothetical protein
MVLQGLGRSYSCEQRACHDGQKKIVGFPLESPLVPKLREVKQLHVVPEPEKLLTGENRHVPEETGR